jgi:CofD-related protein of GAK system
MANAKDSLVTQVPNPMRRIIRNHLHSFIELMPESFDLRGASVGNLIITAGYLNNRRHIEPVIYTFSKLVEARGTVRPITGLSHHLSAELSGGEVVAGQHLLTGDTFELRQQKIENLFLIKTLESRKKILPAIKNKTAELIKSAELICYPFGSFYTSLIATLLPEGVGQAIADTQAPKVYIPNPCSDPEQFSMSLFDCVKTLLRYARGSCSRQKTSNELLQFVVIDSKHGCYNGPLQLQKIEKLGLRIIDTDLIVNNNEVFNNDRLIEVLLSLV